MGCEKAPRDISGAGQKPRTDMSAKHVYHDGADVLLGAIGTRCLDQLPRGRARIGGTAQYGFYVRVAHLPPESVREEEELVPRKHREREGINADRLVHTAPAPIQVVGMSGHIGRVFAYQSR